MYFRTSTLLFLLYGSFTNGVPSPPIHLYPGYNAIADTVPPGGSLSYVHFLGTFNTTTQCVHACVGLGSHHCQSFTYHTKAFNNGGDYAGQCFGLVDEPIWSPVKEDGINSGRVLWPCRSNMDCSLNGKCLPDGTCLCRRAWTGPKCGHMQLLPADRHSGYHLMLDGRNVSSWGGAVLRWSRDDTYHMYLAEMTQHCGINSWILNSQVVHAASDSPTGAFKRVEVLRQPFAHEPDAVHAPTDEFVYYWSENHYNIPLCNCTDGSTHPNCKWPDTVLFYTYMNYNSTPNGPWSQQAKILGPKLRDTDTNFAPVILQNGSLIGFSRGGPRRPNRPFDGSRMYLVTASNWKDPSSYKESQEEVFPNMFAGGVEDPFLYRDEDGYFHAIFHALYPGGAQEVCGGHAFSQDGLHWTYGGAAYGNIVHFQDGGTFSFTRRERPHLVFATDGVTPLALTNGAQYGGEYGDATYTLLQPIAH